MLARKAHPESVAVLRQLPPGSRLLIIRLRSLGDIVLLTPALRLLKQWQPHLKLSVLVESRFLPLLEPNPDVDEVLSYGTGPRGDFNLEAWLRLVREIRDRSFSVCVNLHGGSTSVLLTAFSAAPWRVGFAHFRSRFLYNLQVPDARVILEQSVIHTAEHQASAFFWLGLPRSEIPPPRLVTQPIWQEALKFRLAQWDLGEASRYAVLQPTATFATKRWAPEKFAHLGQFLEREMGLAVIYACGAGQSPLLDQVEHTWGQPIRRCQDWPLGEFIALLAQAHLFVGNDTGPAHLAAAFGRPLVVIFGSSNSRIWRPWRARAQIVQNPFACNPCPGDRCYQFAQPECILSVSVEQVRRAVEAALAAGPDLLGAGTLGVQ